MPLPIYDSSPKSPLSSIRNIIAIAAGKGGVGKSTIAVNLALSLRQMGFAVGLMDADIYGPSVRHMLPEDTIPVQNGQKISPAIACGIRTVSISYFYNEQVAAAIRAPIANRIISQFIQTIDWGPLDFLLIDFPPGTGDVQMTLSQHAMLTGALMVTTPQEIALLDVRKAINLFDRMHVPVLGVVENMSYYIDPVSQIHTHLFGEGGGEKLSREHQIPFLGKIPLDPLIGYTHDKRASLFGKETASASKYFLTLAEQLIRECGKLHQKKKTCEDLSISP